MNGFCQWLINPKNVNANIFTMLTVILSAVISWGISAFYFHMGNRNNVLMSVLNPIKQVLESKTITNDKYIKLETYSKDYSVRYLKKRERKIISELLVCYKEMCRYQYEDVCAESLETYFMYTLKKKRINTEVEPVWIEGEVVDLGKPSDMMYFCEDVSHVLKQYPPVIEEKRCLEKVIIIFEEYCKKYFTDKKITFFEDYTFWDVINKAENKLEWDKKKKRFAELKDMVLKIDK